MVFHQGSSDVFPMKVSIILLLAAHTDSQGHAAVFVMQISCYF